MPVYMINGQKVNFAKEPSEKDIDEAASSLGASVQTKPKGSFRTEVMGPVTAGLSQLAFDIPRTAMKMQVNRGTPGAQQAYDFLYPEQVTTPGKILRGSSEVAGATVGGAGTLASRTFEGMAPVAAKGLLGKVARGAVTGGVFGAATSKPTAEEYGKNIAGNAAFGGALEGVVGVSPTIVSASKKGVESIRGAMTAGNQIKQVQSQLKSVKKTIATIPQREQVLKTGIAMIKKESGLIGQKHAETFKQANALIEGSLRKESLVQSGLNKARLQKVFSKMSETYKQGLDQAENALAAQGKTIGSQEYVDNVVESTLKELQQKGFPVDNKAYSRIVEVGNNLRDKGTQTLSLNDVRNLKNSVFDSLSAGAKSGSKYATLDDQVANIFLRNHGNYIGTMSPELTALNREFAPMADARAWATKNFKPFKDADIERGAALLQKLATSEKPNQTDLNYLMRLEKGLGRFEGAGNLRGGLAEKASAAKFNKESLDSIKKNLIDSTDYRIQQIKDKIANLSTGERMLRDRADNLKELENTLKGLIDLRNKIIWTSAGIAGFGFFGRNVAVNIANEVAGGAKY